MLAFIRILSIPAFLLLAACGLLEPAAVSETPARAAAAEETGSADLTIELEKTMSLAKRSDISLARLCITLSAAGVDSVFDTLKVSGNARIVSTKSYHNLAAGKHWRLRVKSLDRKDSAIHTGTTVFEVLPRQTAKVSLQLASRFTMLRAAFHPIKDSVNRCAIFLDDRMVADTVFTRKALAGDSVILAFDYLHTETWHKLKLAAYGRVWGVDTVLYGGDTTIKTLPGADAAFKLTLNGTGYAAAANGSAAMEVTVGKVGRYSVRAELKDQQAHDGLVLHLPLDGHAKDLSDFANHGTIAGAKAAEDRFGRKDGALAFDGTNDSILVPTAPSLNLKEAMTLSLWVRLDTSKLHMLLGKGYAYYLYSASWGHHVGLSNGAANSPNSSTQPPLKAWIHLVYAWDGLKSRLYVDGALKAEAPSKGQVNDYYVAADLVLGSSGSMNWSNAFLKGALDDVRLYNRGLSDEEVAALHKLEAANP